MSASVALPTVTAALVGRPNSGKTSLLMHLTGSVQVALDFDSEASLVDKVRVAARVSPFLSALVAASPFVRGAPSGE